MDSKHIAAAVAVILGLCFCCQKPKPETPPQEPEKRCPGRGNRLRIHRARRD
jgi:hypothetical protein